jgi:hypothetical protein
MLALLLAAIALQAPSPPEVTAPPAQVERADPVRSAAPKRARPSPAAPEPPPPAAAARDPLRGESGAGGWSGVAGRPAAAVRGPLRGEWPAEASGKRITIDDTTSIDDALEQIADEAGWNVVLNTGRTGNRLLVLKLRSVPVEDALKAALAGTRLVATRTGETVVVAEEEEPERPPAPTLAGFDRPTGRRFTGEFQETPVSDALRQIAKAGGLSIMLPPGKSGDVSASFKDVPVEDALRAVLAQAHLTAEREGELLVVREGRGGLGSAFPAGLGREARRAAEQAMREAERELRRAERDTRDEASHADTGRDRQATGDLSISPGESVRDVQVFRGNLLLQGGSSARDVAAVSGSVLLEGGASARDIVAVLGSVRLAGGATAREVVAVGGDVDVAPGAEVEHDVISVGGRVRIDPAADVGGSSRSIPFPSLPGVLGTATGALLGGTSSPLVMFLQVLIRFAVLFVLGLVVLSVAPRRIDSVAGSMVASPWKAVFAGLLGTVAALVVAILLAVTLVGLLLIPVQVLLVIGGGILGITALCFHVGRSLPLPADRRTMVLQLALGTLIFSVLAQIPVIGAMTWVAAWLLTFGAVLRTRFGQQGAILPTTPAPPEAGAPG